MPRPALLLLFLLACAPKPTPVPSAQATPDTLEATPEITAHRLASLQLSTDPALDDAARAVIEARATLSPNILAEAGLYDDAIRVPSFTSDAVAALDASLEEAISAVRALQWEDLDTDEQIDARWLVACAEETLHRLREERRWRHRPAEWLEPVAATFIALGSYAPDRLDLQLALVAKLPGLFDEMSRELVEPTARDVDTGRDVAEGLRIMLDLMPASPERDDARDALVSWRDNLPSAAKLPDYRVISEASYQWRLERAMLLPWSPDELLALADADLEQIAATLAELEPRLPEPPPPSAEERAEAEALTKEGLIGLYEDMVTDNLVALRAMGVVTVPDDLPPIRARETPDAMVPLTGDGGSMNPPPLFGHATEGWWNVEHFQADWPIERRLRSVLFSRRHRETWYGPYAVHEGVPGHHLQLSIFRDNAHPVRTILWDNAAVEGWGLYAEQLFWEEGGFGASEQAHANVLRSSRYRTRRVVYDVNVETGRWTLQEAADWKNGEPGAEVDRDVLRAIQWPTQLIGYFVGKQQILELREEVRKRQGEAYSDLAFHDALLAEGPVPLTLVRAKLLGEAVVAP